MANNFYRTSELLVAAPYQHVNQQIQVDSEITLTFAGFWDQLT